MFTEINLQLKYVCEYLKMKKRIKTIIQQKDKKNSLKGLSRLRPRKEITFHEQTKAFNQ